MTRALDSLTERDKDQLFPFGYRNNKCLYFSYLCKQCTYLSKTSKLNMFFSLCLCVISVCKADSTLLCSVII